MSDERRRMRLGDTRRVWRGRPFRIDRGVRRLRSRNDTEYLLSNPENARRLLSALEDSRSGRAMMVFESVDELRAALRLAEGE